jgi:hypothetical protein
LLAIVAVQDSGRVKVVDSLPGEIYGRMHFIRISRAEHSGMGRENPGNSELRFGVE